MTLSTIGIILYFFEQMAFISGASLMWSIYRRYRFASHGYMVLSFISWIISSSSRMMLNSMEIIDALLQQAFWIMMNFFLVIGIITTFYSFFYFQYNRMPARANIASLLGGATLLAFCNPDWFELSYISDLGIFIATYDSRINLFAGPLILLFVIVFLLPIYTKYRLATTKEIKHESLSLLIVLSFLLLWAAMSAISSITLVQIIRPFFFAAGWIVWVVLTKRRPLNLIFTQRRFEKVLVMTDSGYPILLYDFETHELDDPSLFSALFSALQSMMKDLMSSSAALKSIYYENKVVTVEKRNEIIFLGIGDEPDTALTVALQVFADNILEKYKTLVSSDGSVIVDLNDDDEIREIIARSFERVIF